MGTRRSGGRGFKEPLSQSAARGLITRILPKGSVAWTKHAEEEMTKDDLDKPDVLNALRAGRIFEPGEEVRGTWRYRVHTDRLAVVVAFRGEEELVVVTAWRKKARGTI